MENVTKLKSPYQRTTYKGKDMDTHRAVMTEAIGRPLKRNEYVHHKNGNKRDNRLENLEIMSPLDHNRHHFAKYPLTKKCVVCGKEFTPSKTKRKRAKTCSHECWLILTQNYAKARQKPIAQYSLEGELIKVWESARQVQNELGFFESNINKCCRHNIKRYKGFVWEYAEVSE